MTKDELRYKCWLQLHLDIDAETFADILLDKMHQKNIKLMSVMTVIINCTGKQIFDVDVVLKRDGMRHIRILA